ncbi:MAG: hypothetical protein IIU94_05480 [Alistipes sp.]|nr:hypothetical protein [Alistipes sp.]
MLYFNLQSYAIKIQIQNLEFITDAVGRNKDFKELKDRKEIKEAPSLRALNSLNSLIALSVARFPTPPQKKEGRSRSYNPNS